MARKHEHEPDDEGEGMRSEPRAVADSGAKAPAPEEVDRAVTRMSEAFSMNVPQEALTSGRCDLPENDSLRLLKNKIPDGSYRVTGHDWILDFAGGQLIGATRATADSEPSSYTAIPQPREPSA